MTSELTRSFLVYRKLRNGALERYERNTMDLILAAVARGEESLGPTRPLSRTFDLKNMKQRDSKWDEVKDIVFRMAWSPESFNAGQAFSGNAFLSTTILRLAILRISEETLLSKILDLKGVPSRKIRPNPYLERGHRPFDSFISSLEKDRSAKELYDATLQLASDPKFSALYWVETNDLRILFHGTNHSVMDNILETGLLPKFRESSVKKDWFSVDYTASLEYTRCRTKFLSGHRREFKLLLFMVLRPDAHSAGVMTSSYVRNQLPLAELTLL